MVGSLGMPHDGCVAGWGRLLRHLCHAVPHSAILHCHATWCHAAGLGHLLGLDTHDVGG